MREKNWTQGERRGRRVFVDDEKKTHVRVVVGDDYIQGSTD
jgi:hypothetical protein